MIRLRQTLRLVSLLGMIVYLSVTGIGCDLSVTGLERDTVDTNASEQDKFRHPHLLNSAIKSGAAGKSTSDKDLYLIVSVADHVLNKQRILERYSLLKRFRILERYEYSSVFNGWAWQISDSLRRNDYEVFINLLLQDPDIKWIEPDFNVHSVPVRDTPGPRNQQIPWSVSAIGGEHSTTVSGDGKGSVDIDLYILDTGVSSTDLNVVEEVDFLGTAHPNAKDHDGHGTHIAGIAAAIDNAAGIVGVAPGARIHNMKVLDDNGRTDVSVVIAAVEHITLQKLAQPHTPMVVNMSLGEDVKTSAYGALDEAIRKSIQAGVVYVVAAGNENKNVSTFTPAKVQEAITVGAYDLKRDVASFSNWGSKVDLFAPGDEIVSLAPNTQSARELSIMSGTSMAVAHVTGAAALYLEKNPQATPAAVKAALLAKARPMVSSHRPQTTNLGVWVGEAKKMVYIVGDDDDMEDEEEDQMDLFASWGYSVVPMSSQENQRTYDAEIATADLIFVSYTANASKLGTKLKQAPVGIICENAGMLASLGIATGTVTYEAEQLYLHPQYHYITEGLGSGALSLINSKRKYFGVHGLLAPGLQVLGSRDGSQGGILAINKGDALLNRETAAGRRVILPWNDSGFDFNHLNAYGQRLFRRAFDWAAGAGPQGTPTYGRPTLQVFVASRDDDAMESLQNGSVNTGDSGLRLGENLVGLRFTDIDIPVRANIKAAYIQFSAKEQELSPATLAIYAENTDNTAPFRSQRQNISSRSRTHNMVSWVPTSWQMTSERAMSQRTPDITSILREVVARPGWQRNGVGIIVTGSGRRTVSATDDNPSQAPMLHIEWEP